MIRCSLLGTGSLLPGRPVSSREVAKRAVPPLAPEFIEQRAGIVKRHWVEPGTRSAPLGAEVLRQALSSAGMDAKELRRILFVASTGGDWLIPATATRIVHELGLTGQCDALDINNGCVGFLSALDLASRSVATGCGPVAIVTVEIFSDMLMPDEPRCYAIFGDAAAAVVVGPGAGDDGLLGSRLGSDPTLGLTASMEHPRFSGRVHPLRFGISNRTMSEEAVGYLVRAAREALSEAELSVADIDWVLPHQPNGNMFDQIIAALEVPAERTVKLVGEIGSTGAASIPVALDRLVRTGQLHASSKLLLVSVGAGVSYGAVVVTAGQIARGPHDVIAKER
ncbi:MAG: ketoacyl-ACP synthase III [Myxococcales bacterium]|nr:ketoacyl-ACP synthase III [Myxococcales bacterium]